MSEAALQDFLGRPELLEDSADGYPRTQRLGREIVGCDARQVWTSGSGSNGCRDWKVNVSSAGALADTLRREWENALLFRKLATLRTDIELFKDVEELRWNGPKPEFEGIAAELDGAVTEKKAKSVRQ